VLDVIGLMFVLIFLNGDSTIPKEETVLFGDADALSRNSTRLKDETAAVDGFKAEALVPNAGPGRWMVAGGVSGGRVEAVTARTWTEVLELDDETAEMSPGGLLMVASSANVVVVVVVNFDNFLLLCFESKPNVLSLICLCFDLVVIELCFELVLDAMEDGTVATRVGGLLVVEPFAVVTDVVLLLADLKDKAQSVFQGDGAIVI
jgi:hypothetical protein